MTATARYSEIDRLLHRLAFASLNAQKAISDIEDGTQAARFASVAAERPVFITSMPRAGTTLMLETVVSMGGFASHTYRDMPFVLCPLTWDGLSKGFRRRADLIERAHGDGMVVGFDSPEALEEVLWRAFWPLHYQADRIAPWSDQQRHEEFETFFRNHMRKIVALRLDGEGRYVSKNNANIARTGLLSKIFPDSLILVPFRESQDHIGSLMNLHRRFLQMHAEDPFARAYMTDIGHFEFGQALRPIGFLGQERLRDLDPCGPDFWLESWSNAFSHLLERAPGNVVFVSYDRLCAEPMAQLERLTNLLGVERPGNLDEIARRLARPTFHAGSLEGADSSRLSRARSVYEALLSRAGGASAR